MRFGHFWALRMFCTPLARRLFSRPSPTRKRQAAAEGMGAVAAGVLRASWRAQRCLPLSARRRGVCANARVRSERVARSHALLPRVMDVTRVSRCLSVASPSFLCALWSWVARGASFPEAPVALVGRAEPVPRRAHTRRSASPPGVASSSGGHDRHFPNLVTTPQILPKTL